MSITINEFAAKIGLREDQVRLILQMRRIPLAMGARTLSDGHVKAVEEHLAGEKNRQAEAMAEKAKQAEEAAAEAARQAEERAAAEAEEQKRKAEEAETARRAERKAVARAEKISTGVELPETITVKEFAEKLGIAVTDVLKTFIKNGMLVTINHKIDIDTATIIAEEFGVKVTRQQTDMSSKELLEGNLTSILATEDREKQTVRPPIITVMGHVDHGKTSLLDYIRKTTVAAGEAGGITQRIGAYQAKDGQGNIFTFLDTPGHEAFTAMRARGAAVTDIAILVVAADEGIRPQTIEAISHIKSANVPLVVALNKIDKDGANPEVVMAQLAEHQVVSDTWGGDTPMVQVSAKTGQGIDKLLELLQLQAEILELRADSSRAGVGTVLETHMDKSLGHTATVLMNTGTLKVGDSFVVGESYGRVKGMKDANGKNTKQAGPAVPVQLFGLSGPAMVGDILHVTTDDKSAREKAHEISLIRKNAHLRDGGGSLAEIMNRIQGGNLKQLKIVLKADTLGTLEAVRAAILKIQHDEVMPYIIHSGIGDVNESDVLLASTSEALIVCFNSVATTAAQRMAEREHVEVMTFRVIYHLTEKIMQILEGLLDPEIREIDLGDLNVLAVFFTTKREMIIGGRVLRGKMVGKCAVRVIRGDKQACEGHLREVRVGEKIFPEVGQGECGLKIEGRELDIQPGDIVNCYKTEKVEKKLM